MDSNKNMSRSDQLNHRSAEGFHKHQCSDCGSIWEHSDLCVADETVHTCKCGHKQWKKYNGPIPPD